MTEPVKKALSDYTALAARVQALEHDNLNLLNRLEQIKDIAAEGLQVQVLATAAGEKKE